MVMVVVMVVVGRGREGEGQAEGCFSRFDGVGRVFEGGELFDQREDDWDVYEDQGVLSQLIRCSLRRTYLRELLDGLSVCLTLCASVDAGSCHRCCSQRFVALGETPRGQQLRTLPRLCHFGRRNAGPDAHDESEAR